MKTIPVLSPSEIERFWSKVKKTETCWMWQAATSAGYGNFRVAGKTFGAHRLSAFLAGKLTDEGQLVCHSCDTPACVNPDHLFTGTPSDNTDDGYRKGRIRPPVIRGQSHHECVCPDGDVRRAVEMHANGTPQTEIARALGVHPNAVWRWVSGRDRNEATGIPRPIPRSL